MQPDPVHRPDHYVECWLEGDTLCVRIPNSHTLRLPTRRMVDDDNVGYECFLRIMQERAIERGNIGTDSAPVQYDLEGIMRHWKQNGGYVTRIPSTAEAKVAREEERAKKKVDKMLATMDPETLAEMQRLATADGEENAEDLPTETKSNS